MGWTYYRPSFYKNGKVDRKAELDYNYGNRVVKSQMVGTTWFAAIKSPYSDEVWAAIYLTAVDKGDFGYKDMDETMGPYNYACPKSILKLLTPTDNKLANEWREKCYEYHRQKAEKKSGFSYRKAKRGSKIQWTTPLDLTSGHKAGDVLLLTKVWSDGPRGYWKSEGGYRYGYKLLEKGKCTIVEEVK